MAIESKKRKLAQRGAGAGHRKPRQLAPRLIEDEASDEEGDESDDQQDAIRGDSARHESASESEREEPEDEKDEEEEEEDDEDDEDDDDDEEEDDDDDEEEQPPSPSETLTFGQILKKQEKAKQMRSGGSKAPTGGAQREQKEGKHDKARPKIPKTQRSSKHAPAELPARFAVKRGRDWTSGDAAIAGVSVRPAAARARDPRFFLASMREGPPSATEEQRARRNYAFLEGYRDAELQQLREGLAGAERARKAAARKKKAAAVVEAAEAEVAELRKQVGAMEARKRAQEERDRAQAVLEAHKQRERELVRQGKTPYYLKRSEQKKRLLVERFAGMTEQQVDKALERRRKKAAVRERQAMPERRGGA